MQTIDRQSTPSLLMIPMANTLILNALVQKHRPANTLLPVTSATELLKSSDLGNPPHIIIHTGTNDLEKLSAPHCMEKYNEMVRVASENYPLWKIVISALLVRADIVDQQRQELNTKLGNLCTPYPNVHIVRNDNITPDHLHDDKYLKRRQIGLLVTNL